MMLQLVPFQCSISVWLVPLRLGEYPTAQMSLRSEARRAGSAWSPDPRFGLVMMLQLVPFQCSISVWLVRLRWGEYPTAEMSLAVTAIAPASSLSPDPRFGLVMMLQLVPFQCSISVWLVPLRLGEYPTAQMSL